MIKKHGFTIVELLIVIVVIGILAAISIVSYNGVRSRSADTAIKSDFNNMAKLVKMYSIDNGNFPDASAILSIGLKPTYPAYSYTENNSTALYCRNNKDFGFTAVSASKKVITYTAMNGVSVDAHNWTTSAAPMCTSIGIGSTSAGYTARWLNYNAIWY